MSDFSGLKINKKNGGLGRRNPSTDGVFALIMGGVATGDCPLNTVKKLIQVSDAEDLGLDAAYDANNSILVHHHIDENFRLNPDGTLYIMLVARQTDVAGTSMTAMCDKTTVEGLKKLLTHPDTNKEIKFAGVVLNPDMASYVPTMLTGLDKDALDAVPKAQELIADLRSQNIYIDGILIEGREANGTIANMKDLRTMASENVSIVIAADPVIQALDADYAKYAAVGAALGMESIRKVNESLGSLDIANKPSLKKGEETYPLNDSAKNRFVTAALSSGKLFSELTAAERTSLTNKGYIFAGSYEGYPGIYFNDSPTCTEAASDFAYIENNRTWNKAARYALKSLTPKINSTVDVDKATGFIKPTTIAAWEAAANKEVGKMLTDNEADEATLYIDPAQNVLGGEPIMTKLAVQPKGVARKIDVDLGFSNPFKV